MKAITIRTENWEITLEATGRQQTVEVTGTPENLARFTAEYPGAMDEGTTIPTEVAVAVIRREIYQVTN
jgi:hypothetical protein